MTNRTPLVLTASIAAALALPAAAAAHDAAAVPSCTAAVVTGTLFAPGPNPVQVTVTTATGEVVTTTLTLANGVPVSVPYVLSPGAHEVAVWLSWTLPDHTRRPYVAGRASVACPAPTPAPPVVEVVPGPLVPAAVPPPVVAPPAPPVKEGGRKKPTLPLVPRRTERVLRAVACRQVGERGYAIVRIRVVWQRGGAIVKTRTATVRRPGPVCIPIAVAG